MIRSSAAIALAASLAAMASPAAAQVEAGMLECSGTTTSFIVGSVTELRCAFRPGGGAPAIPYIATIRRVGVDIALPANVGMAWGVFAPTRMLAPGDLAEVTPVHPPVRPRSWEPGRMCWSAGRTTPFRCSH